MSAATTQPNAKDVAETKVGTNVDVEVWRKGEIKELKVALGELEAAEEQLAALDPKERDKPVPQADVSSLGMTLSQMTPELRQQFNIQDDVNGVVVTEVDEESAAGEKGIRPGDVIVEVGQEEVEKPDQVAEKIEKEQESSKRKTVLLLVQRAGDLMFVAVRLTDDS